MRFSNLSLLAGNEICNARCPFCISKMTPLRGVSKKKPLTDWRNFHKAARLARNGGAQTVLITGKGEPTLFPEHVTEYLKNLESYQFEFIELQTNGILIQERADIMSEYLKLWYDLGLTTIAISVVHYDAIKNKEIYTPNRAEYINLSELISTLHKANFTVRLASILINGYIDSEVEVENLINFSRENGVEQLSMRPVNMPSNSRDQATANWTKDHLLSSEQIDAINNYVSNSGKILQRLSHGAEIYDLKGQNVCITNSLTLATNGEEARQLIFFPNGNLAYDWQYEAALLLRGKYAEKSEYDKNRKLNESSLHLLSA
jgi:molybdenum cofactor biosynthesis enzyme MoaA